MIRKKLLRGLCLTSLVIAAAACQGPGDDSDMEGDVASTPDERGADILAHLAALPEARVLHLDAAAVPRFVMGDLGKIEVATRAADTDFRAALDALAPVFRANAEELVLQKSSTDEDGVHHFRFSQVKNGLRVIGAELLLHARDGVIHAANGNARADLNAARVPEIDEADARRIARDATEAMDVAVKDDVELAYRVSEVNTDRLDLVYAVDVMGMQEDGLPLHDTVLVDALDGTIVQRLPHIHAALTRNVYSAGGGTTLPGTLARSEGQSVVGDGVVNANYDWLGVVHDCYSTLLARDSYDGLGAPITSTVRYGVNNVNAFWNGSQLVFGGGNGTTIANLASALDLTAHEFTHAVTQSTSNLAYTGESGGINESLSDIMASLCEWNLDGKVVSADTWKVGEDVWTPAISGDAMRYMNDPALDGASADHYADYHAAMAVHHSSGISNLAFYLLAQGGTHPRGQTSVSVTGIGIEKAAKTFHRANTQYLTSTATFLDLKAATQAASTWTLALPERDQVLLAWEAVGVGTPNPAPLTNNVAVTGLGGKEGSVAYFSLNVPATASSLTFTISGGTGDADLYVRSASLPTISTYECRPYLPGNSETCTITGIQPGTYYVMLQAFTAYAGVSLQGSFTAPAGYQHLVINEIDYDNIGTDGAEYVEVYNPTGATVDLTGHSLVFINGGDNTAYMTVDLASAGTLTPGQYLVVGSTAVTTPAGAKKIAWSGAQSNRIQNDKEGVALVRGSAVLDKLSYEGGITAAIIPGVGTVSLVEGTVLSSSVADSNTIGLTLGRTPNGQDADNANAEWQVSSTLTPGAANP
ncbi:M4 family metallopeptidase [Chondromyces apiculatus]|nr:M4 family metallopeptidase [Chondromyces apiculatus]